jgi:ribosomal protein S18 acetylase RimI-like enzyme
MASIVTSIDLRLPQLRPLNIIRDLPAVADLVEKCFADTMDAEGRNYLQQMRRAGQDNFFLRWASNAVETVSMPLSGYIWEENGEIIGNVSLIPYHQGRKKIYLVANVAVRTDFRKRGIGRALTQAAMEHAKQHHASETWLHVREDNPGAIALYLDLGFIEQARRTGWQAEYERVTPSWEPGFLITKRISRDWPSQETWLHRLYPSQLGWYDPLPWASFRPGIWYGLYRFLLEYDIRHWVARTGSTATAVISCQTISGGNTRLWAAFPPEGDEKILTSLLQYARHASFSRSKISLDLPAGHYLTALQPAGFQPTRTLLWMKNDETSLAGDRKSI